jgi:hypothetical protein
LINVSLKSTLSEISIATPACFRGAIGLVNLLPAFHPKPVLGFCLWAGSPVSNRLLALPF